MIHSRAGARRAVLLAAPHLAYGWLAFNEYNGEPAQIILNMKTGNQRAPETEADFHGLLIVGMKKKEDKKIIEVEGEWG